MTTTTKLPWPASDLRITKNQAEFLANGLPPSTSPGLSERTETSLSQRKMLGWVLMPSGHGSLRANAKGRAALAKYHGRTLVAANDNNKGTLTDAA
ncbi:MAG: hypothetical protein ACTHNH_20975 [Mesorhizobium sp.]